MTILRVGVLRNPKGQLKGDRVPGVRHVAATKIDLLTYGERNSPMATLSYRWITHMTLFLVTLVVALLLLRHASSAQGAMQPNYVQYQRADITHE